MSSPFDIGDELAAALEDPGPVPSSGPALVRYAGGRRELTRQLAGMEGPPKRREYPDEAAYRAASTRWRSASRRAQRWDDEGKPGKQSRGRSRVTLAPAQRERVYGEAADRRLLGLFRHGARMRLEALIRVSSPGPGRRAEPARTRTMPAGGAGVYISPDELRPALEAAAAGNNDEASYSLLVAFGESYGWDLDGVEFEEISRVKIWPEGEREPA